MSFLFYQLRRLIMFPVEFFTSDGGAIGSLWRESGRSRALLLGLPAILCAVVGVIVVLWAQFGMADSLEDWYKGRAETSKTAKEELAQELQREAKMLQAAGHENLSELIPRDDPRIVRLNELRTEEEVYLEKLIDLNQNEPEYLFQLAMVALGKKDQSRALALLRKTAPLDEPGFIKGHLWLANFHMNKRPAARAEALQNVTIALKHAEQCLKRDKDNLPAKRVKALLLRVQKNYVDAYQAFADLFETEPRYFEALIDINKQMGLESRNEKVLDSAVMRFSEELKQESLADAERTQIWNYLTTCYRELRDFPSAEQMLLQEIKAQSVKPEDSGNRVWAERLLATVYLSWCKTINPSTLEGRQQRFEYLKRAYSYDSTNPIVLKELTRTGASQDAELANSALAIYNPTGRADAPASVLNEIGAQALGRKDYESALRYFEMAREKSPKSPEILNNLSYTYTVGNQPNPKRALKLIDEALRFLPNNKETRAYMSFFRDTRGRALLQLGRSTRSSKRITEAIAEFEFALMDRPNNVGILKALVECYDANGLDPTPYVKKIQALSDANPAVPIGGGGEAPNN